MDLATTVAARILAVAIKVEIAAEIVAVAALAVAVDAVAADAPRDRVRQPVVAPCRHRNTLRLRAENSGLQIHAVDSSSVASSLAASNHAVSNLVALTIAAPRAAVLVPLVPSKPVRKMKSFSRANRSQNTATSLRPLLRLPSQSLSRLSHSSIPISPCRAPH